jgi:DNA-binding transcriptional MerR regulator
MSRAQSLQAARKRGEASEDAIIPNKAYFRIGEVSQLAQTKPYVLRYWETEFPVLRPTKTKSGHRLYRRKDVEIVLEIKRLLYERGFTIVGARKQLNTGGRTVENAEQQQLFRPPADGTGLREIQRELRSILTMLSRKPTVTR